MASSSYVIRGGLEGRERLRILSRVMQPTTRGLFERTGLRPGMSCLDLGCGGGDVTFEMARAVGPDGRVIGVDLDATKIDLARNEAAALGLSNVEFRVGRVEDSIGSAEFDLAYGRFLLTHLTDPGAVVALMLSVLRPGGRIAVEDIDCSGHFCHPEIPAFRRYVDLYSQAVRRRGADPDIGPRLPKILRDRGVRDVGVNVVQPAGMAGEVKLIAALTMESIVEALLAERLAERAEIDEIVGALHDCAEDDSTLMSLPRVVQAWGRSAG